jgi:hypothetical protein
MGATLTLDLREEHYPFWSRGRLGGIKEIALFAAFPVDANGESTVHSLGVTMPPNLVDNTATLDILAADTAEWKGLLVGHLDKGAPAELATGTLPPDVDLTLNFAEAPGSAAPMTDLWIAIRWGKA